jgi:hypothetical protein
MSSTHRRTDHLGGSVTTKLAVGKFERLSREVLLALSVVGFVGAVLIFCSAAGVKFFN